MSNFSVIVPVYYGGKYIPDIIRQIESCREHLKREDYIEILFVNDAPDAPLDLGWHSETVNISVINTDKNVGIHGARIKGIKRCTGDYVMFLDQDDKIVPEYFLSQMRKLGKCDAVVCKALNGGLEYYVDDAYFPNIPFKKFMLKEGNLILSPGQVLIKKEVIPDTWKENIMENNGADDWFLWICMLAEECCISLNENILFEHVLQGYNTSNNIMSMLHSEQEMLNIIYEKKILSDYDFGLLLKGICKKNRNRTQRLYLEKEKLDCLTKWIRLKEKNVNLIDYLLRSGFQRISVYGCGVLGEFVYNELNTAIRIKYFIDRNAKYIKKRIPVYSLDEHLPEVDCVILTLIGETENVERELKEKGMENILVLKNWVADMETKFLKGRF